eukprot:CAMPEP_0185321022 /NCGR_PEP_ID=MMETSP1363-20130426/56183_1 /TAXON_ID=38817 /ORGANISM="Gephyrocapsa oceanica, Strain RCC1303" /LENGTH=186 /DNA_ID=CAMNT_0027919491 /DNA_START=54 /DNA_END=613 /DNA_ORIENTATION=+
MLLCCTPACAIALCAPSLPVRACTCAAAYAAGWGTPSPPCMGRYDERRVDMSGGLMSGGAAPEEGREGAREGEGGVEPREPELALVARAAVPRRRAAHQEKWEGDGSEELDAGREGGRPLRAKGGAEAARRDGCEEPPVGDRVEIVSNLLHRAAERAVRKGRGDEHAQGGERVRRETRPELDVREG